MEGDITVPTSRDKYGNTKTNCYCEICGKFLNLQDLDTHKVGKKHLFRLNRSCDKVIYIASKEPSVKTKIGKLINKIVFDAITNVKKANYKIYFNKQNRYFRYTRLRLSDGVSSKKKCMEHALILINQMTLPDLPVNAEYSDGDSCVYGCSNHSYQMEDNMLARVEGIKIALEILFTTFDDKVESDPDEKIYEDPRWCIDYYEQIEEEHAKVEALRAQARANAWATYKKVHGHND